jgi:hypothetical protein
MAGTAGGVGVVELDREGLAEQAREWVRRTCEEQGLPHKITEPSVIALVVEILKTADLELRTSSRRAPGRGRNGSGPGARDRS